VANVTIDQLDPALVTQAEEFLAGWLKAEYPSMDLTEGGVLRDILLRSAALFHVLEQTDLDRLRRSMSLKAIEEDPSLADDTIVDGVLSNYRIVRSPGTKASGIATIILSTNTPTAIDVGTIFEANGLKFLTTDSYVAVTDPSLVLSSTQRLILARNDGSFAFTVPVEAELVGDAYKLRRNTKLTITPSPVSFVDSFAAQDFSGGSNAETNEELIARFKNGLTQTVLSGRAQVDSLLKALVPTTTAISQVGYGDPEMLRDRHNIFSISTGGKADLYTRTQAYPETIVVKKTALLVDKPNKTWQISINRNDAPGFYSIEAVLPTTSDQSENSFEITQESRALDMTQTANEFVPYADNLVEGAYSRYQTAVIRFIDTETDHTSLTQGVSTQDYNVYILHMPNIGVLQDNATSRAVHNPTADYLVRAPIPAFVTMSLKVLYTAKSIPTDITTLVKNLKTKIVERVNALNFDMGRLPSSIVYDAAHDVVGKSGVFVVSPLDMNAYVKAPDGSTINLHSLNELVIPNSPAIGVTSRTTVFYLTEEFIDVEVQNVPALPV
jgi:hypothetical protein